jgi:thiol-disulfide isomerase/thioredoxin
MQMRKKILIALMVLSVVGVSVAKGVLSGWAVSRGTMVIFTANWCASCREVIPLVRDIASQNNIAVSEIDVDSVSAPKQAQGLGLTLPQDEPPQVFFVNKGRAVLIYNGKNYRFGYQDSAKTTILQNLQTAL